MATQWQTFPIEFKGGLISNMSLLQQGSNAIGSAQTLKNFEVNKEGGYTKILGYDKFSTTVVPGEDEVLCVKIINADLVLASRKIDAATVTARAADGLVTGDLGKTAYYTSTGTTWTFKGKSGQTNGLKAKFAEFNFDGDDKIVIVDGTSYPAIYNTNGNTLTFLTSSSANINTDLQGAERVAIFKNTGFYSKGNTLYFAAPYTVDNFSVALGAGNISLAHDITGIAVFRDQLIVFTSDTISRLTGTSSADFQLSPITEKIGCINGDTIQEVGGDIMYLSPDGIRQLSATDRIGDFALDVASDKIKETANDFLNGNSNFCSYIIRGKSQYRLFAYRSSRRASSSEGLIAVKLATQGSAGIEWSTVTGMKVNVADSVYSGDDEFVMFANNDGYIYESEKGSSFDGTTIDAIFQSAFMPINDPNVRKTLYKAVWFIDPLGTLNLDFNVKFDFESNAYKNVLQPNTVPIVTTSGSVAFFGQGFTFGSTGTNFGSNIEKIYPVNVIGSGKTVSLRIQDLSSNPSFTLDSAMLEYKTNDRQ